MNLLKRENLIVVAACCACAIGVAILGAARGVVWAWVAISFLGLLLSLFLTNESRRDLLALPNRTNGRRSFAWSRALREGLRVTVHALYLVAGLAVLELVPGRGLVVPILLWGNIVLVLNSLIDWRTRWLLFQTRDKEPTLPH